MSGLKILGVVLIVLGAVALGYKKFTYNKKHELFKIGDTAASVTLPETKTIPTWVGFALVGGGIVCVVLPRKKA